MPVREAIKHLLVQEDITITYIAEKLSKKHNKKISVDSISKKLLKGTMKYNEAEQIVDILGYEITFKKK